MHNRNFATYRMRGDISVIVNKGQSNSLQTEFPLSLLADEVALNTCLICLSSNYKAGSQQADISLHNMLYSISDHEIAII